MKNRKKISLGVSLCFAYTISALGQIGINTESPKSTLDVSGGVETNQIAGIQAPRLTLTELANKGNGLYGTNQRGAIIYITDMSGAGNTGQRANITVVGYYYFDGSSWQKLGVLEDVQDAIGDIKYSFMPSDHEGWYLLDGRIVSALPANIQAAANSLGFIKNIPDASDRLLKTKTNTETLAGIGGTNSLVIAQTNLPSLSLSGTISGTSGSGGTAHTHTFSGTAASGGAAHTHTFSGTSANAGAHTHTFTRPTQALVSHRGVIQLSSLFSIDNDQTLSSSSAGAHTHTFSGTSGSTTHTHTFSGTSVTDGAHTHTVSGTASVPTGGSGTALNNRPAYLNVNAFVYLGK